METVNGGKIILGLELNLILFYVGKVLFFPSILFKLIATFHLQVHLYFKPLQVLKCTTLWKLSRLQISFFLREIGNKRTAEKKININIENFLCYQCCFREEYFTKQRLENIHKITLIINNSVPIQAKWLCTKYLNIFKEQCFRKSWISINWSTCHLKKLQWLLPWKITVSQIYGYFCLFFLYQRVSYITVLIISSSF